MFWSSDACGVRCSNIQASDPALTLPLDTITSSLTSYLEYCPNPSIAPCSVLNSLCGVLFRLPVRRTPEESFRKHVMPRLDTRIIIRSFFLESNSWLIGLVSLQILTDGFRWQLVLVCSYDSYDFIIASCASVVVSGANAWLQTTALKHFPSCLRSRAIALPNDLAHLFQDHLGLFLI